MIPDGANPSEGICKQFCADKELRSCVFGMTQLCLDLCYVLGLPRQVALSSLVCLQKFLAHYFWKDLELPFFVASCILITWKYWEDLLPIKDARKLMELAREIYHLLMVQDTSDDDSASVSTGDDEDKDEEKKEKEKEKKITEKPSTPEPKRARGRQMKSKESKSKEESKNFAGSCHKKVNPEKRQNKKRKRNSDGSYMSISDWIFRDEGREYQRIRERIKVCESYVLQSINFEIGPFEVPLNYCESYCRNLWNDQPEQLKKKTSSTTSSTSKYKQNSSPPNDNTSLDLHNSNKTFSDEPTKNSSFTGTTENKIRNGILRMNQHVARHQESLYSRVTCVPPSINSGVENAFDDKSHYQVTLNHFLYLTNAIVFDLYRTPFCLLSSCKEIAVAAVWKAAVALQLKVPFEDASKSFMCSDVSFDWSVYFPVKQQNLRKLIHQFRLTYEWLREFHNQSKIPKHQSYHEIRENVLKHLSKVSS